MEASKTGFNLNWAKSVSKEEFVKQHAHIDGADEWYDKHVHAHKEEKPKEKAK